MSSGYEKEKERNRFAVTGKGKPEGALYIQRTAKSGRSEETHAWKGESALSVVKNLAAKGFRAF